MWIQNLLGAIEGVSGALLQLSEAGLQEGTFASGVDLGAGVSWSDMPDIDSAFDPGDILSVGYGNPPSGSGDMIVLPNYICDFDPEPRRIFRDNVSRECCLPVFTHSF